MKEYISGYYCRDDLHLQIMNKDSNRKILGALREAYPRGLTVEDLVKKTKLPEKTIYAQKAELYREYYVNHFEEERNEPKRGRPSTYYMRSRQEMLRKRVKLVIEETSGLHDPYRGKKPTPLPPGNVVYSDGFTDMWHKIVGKEYEEQLCKDLLHFIKTVFDRLNQLNESRDYVKVRMEGREKHSEYEKIRKNWAPENELEFCCSHCGLNHEARDFIRATLLHLMDQLERKEEFLDFLKDNQFLTKEAYNNIVTKAKE